MKVLFAAAEASPWAKVGGLADVVGSLPRALTPLGVEARIALPAYGFIMDALRPHIVSTKTGIEVPFAGGRRIHSVVHIAESEGLTLMLIDGEERFKRVMDRRALYDLGREDWLYFSQAVLRACESLGWMPDVIHSHDWQMGFLPVFMRERKGREWEKTASCFTIHNFSHQGVFGQDTLDLAGLPHSLFTYDKLETYGSVNMLKSGAAYSEQVSTVSPTYAVEITSEEQGGVLTGLMKHLRTEHRLKGILNGINVEGHDPKTDPDLPAHFSLEDISGKAICRAGLIEELSLDADEKTLVCGMVSRLADQKGFDLLIPAVEQMIKAGCVVAVQGQGDAGITASLKFLAEQFPGKMVYASQFDPDLAQRIYAGSDVFLMPSRYEPCGLGQMFAMRYGTLPVVHYTGGLADTVTEDMTGFTFTPHGVEEFMGAIRKAVATFADQPEWQRMIRLAMREDWSWNRTAPDYLEMYKEAIAARS